MKKKSLTRKLILAAIVWLIIICASGGVYFYLDAEITSLEDTSRKDNSVLKQNDVELEDVAKNIQNSETAFKMFVDFSGSEDNNRNLFRKNILNRKLGEIVKEMQGAVKLTFKMEPFSAYTTIPSTKNVEIVSSKVIIGFGALTDIDAFKVIELIQEKLNGTVYFKKLEITKVQEIDSAVLLDTSNGNHPSLVNGSAEFEWISIRLKEPQSASLERSNSGVVR